MAKLYFYYSAMNAGKSTMLLQSSYNYHERGMSTLLLTPEHLNHGGGGNVISSRIGIHSAATPYGAKTDLYAMVRQRDAENKIHCVLVDEAQFLTRAQVYQLTEIVDQCEIPVLAYGLRTDFRGELFEGSQYLLAWADELKELKTICPSGKKATMVLRLNDQGEVIREGAQVEVGGNERYLSVSRKEFKLRLYGPRKDR